MAYLKIYSSQSGYIGLSLDTLVRKIGYIPNHRKNKLNDQVLYVLYWLQQRDGLYFEDIHIEEIINKNEIELVLYNNVKIDKSNTQCDNDNIDKTKVKRNDCFLVQINNVGELFNPDGSFVFLTESEFCTITQKESIYSKEDILNVFLNIKKRINFNETLAQICYPSHTTLSKDCNLSRGNINNIIDTLVTWKLLYTYNSGRFEDNNGKLKYANNFYAVKDGELKPDVCDNLIKDYYSNQGIIIKDFIKEKESK